MGADRVRPRTANGQQKLAVQQQPMKRRTAPSKYGNAGTGSYQNGFAQQQMPQQTQLPRTSRYEDQEDEPEFKAAKRVQSADLLSKLSHQSLRKYCRVHKIGNEDRYATREQLLNSILFHWKRQIVDDKQVLRKFAFALQENSKREQN